MDRGRDQHALAVLARQLEHCVPHVLSGRVVQQEVIPAPRGNFHRVGSVGQVVQRVGVDARRIDDAARLAAAAVGIDLPTAPGQWVQTGDFGVKPEPHAVFGCVFGQGVGQAKGADDAAGGCPQGGDGSVGNVRFHRDQLVALDDAQPFHAVGDAVLVEFLQRGAVVLTQADDKTAALVVGKVQLLGKGRHTAAALDVELRHQAAVCGVVPGVNDGTVGLGRAAADVLLFLQHQNIRVIARKFPCAGTPGHARANDDDIVHILYLVLFVCRACRGDHWSPAESVRCWKPSGSMRASTPTA